MVIIPNTTSNAAISGLRVVSLSFMYFVHRPKLNNTGKVPNAKTPIINAHCTALPLCKANNCIPCVKPHGRKKVRAHTNIAYFGFLRESAFFPSQAGK